MTRHAILTFVAAVTLLASSTAARAQETIDFEDLNEGDIVTQVFGDAGGGPVGVDGFNPRFGAGTDAAMIFDSDCEGGCTGGDPDLGAPNADFAGPGVGAGGESGQPFQNDRALGNTLIVSEDLDGTDPDDEGGRDGVTIDFDFSALGTVTLFDMDVIDVEPRTEEGAVANLYGPGDALITSIAIATTGDNGLVNVDLGPTAGVTRLEVVLNGSGAVDNITFLADEQGECGNDVVDAGEECDGTDDGQCPGACRADCTCPVCGDGIVDEGEECDDGNNEDGDGCSATCEIEDRGGEGCTPGYWKQPHHFDSWVEVAPTDNFNDVFGTNATFSTKFCASADPTLLEALECKGGSLGSLARHAVAALLNALSGGVDYELSDADVVDLVQEAIASGEHEDAKDLLKDENEEGCPLN